MRQILNLIFLTAAMTVVVLHLPPTPPLEPLTPCTPDTTIIALDEPEAVIETSILTTESLRYEPTPWERKLLAALAEQEDSSDLQSMQAVVEVVLNRIESDAYDFAEQHSIEDVLYHCTLINGTWIEQYQGSAQLASIQPSDLAFEAVDRACSGECIVPDALFHAAEYVEAWRICNGITKIAHIGRTSFYKLTEGT